MDLPDRLAELGAYWTLSLAWQGTATVMYCCVQDSDISMCRSAQHRVRSSDNLMDRTAITCDSW